MAIITAGQTVVTTAGTAVPLGTEQISGLVKIKALDTNTGIVAFGNDGSNDVTVSNGFRLAANAETVISVGNLSELYLDSAVNGEGVSWHRMNLQ